MPAYALVVADSGPKLTEALAMEKAPGAKEPILSSKIMVKSGDGQLALTGPVSGLADALSAQLGRQVIDKTGLKGNYDVMLHWSTSTSANDSLPSAVQEQLGLKLDTQQQPVQTLAVDQIEMPSEK
jgi:uncharacterized protein (TIGR03435 family)